LSDKWMQPEEQNQLSPAADTPTFQLTAAMCHKRP
jgi:hypothetical protein